MPAARGTLTSRLRVIVVGLVVLLAALVGAIVPGVLAIRSTNTELADTWLPARRAAFRVTSSFVDQETAQRGYVITDDETFLAPFVTGRAAAEAALARLEQLVPDLADEVAVVRRRYRSWRSRAEEEVELVRSGRIGEAHTSVAQGAAKARFDGLRDAVAGLDDVIERRVAAAENDVRRANASLLAIVVIGAGAAVVFAVLARRLLRSWAHRADAEQQTVRELGEATRLVAGITSQTPDPIFLKDADHRYRFVNESAARALGAARVGDVTDRLDSELVSDPARVERLQHDDDVVLAAMEPQDFVEEVGDRKYLVTKSPYQFGDGTVGVLGVGRDVTDRVRSESRARAMGELGEAIGRESTPHGVARAAVEPLRRATGADLVWIMVVTEDGRALEALVDDATEGRRTTSAAWSERWSLVPTEGSTPHARVHRTGEPVLVHASSPAEATPVAAVLVEESLDTVVFLPLVAGSQSVGVLDLGWRDGEREPDAEERAFHRRLATMLAEALARAIAAEFQRTVVATFQRALVPDEAYASTLDVAARYEPAEDLVTVGGDWFDVFDLDEHRMGLAVGDVVGNGIGAAAVMGRLRSALRAITLVVGDPAVALDHLDAFATDVRGALGTTVVLAVFDRRDNSLRYASAGHPPPVWLHHDGTRLLDAARGRPLGIALPDVEPRASEVVSLERGDLFVAYSDGLVERRTEPIDAGIDRLRSAVARMHDDPIEDLADALLRDVGGVGVRTDDTVLLCARLADPESSHFSARVAADPRELAGLRRRMGEWLRDRDVAESVVAEVLVAVSEAVANAMEHAYGLDDAESVVVGAAIPGPIVVTVRDRGPWRPSLGRSDRGRGIQLMRSLMDEIEFSTSASGTLVRMTKSCATG